MEKPSPIYSFTFESICIETVYNDLQSLDCESNSGVLNLDTKLLKLSANVICESLTHLFHLSLNSKIIPGEWKIARITPIYKGTGDIHLETNYRPISVLSHIAKIFERWVHEQLVHYLEFHSLITPYQSAYLKKHSTVTCLHHVVDDMYESIDDGLVCGVCFLDIEKCFDTINHDILLQKLKHYGIGGNAFDCFTWWRHQMETFSALLALCAGNSPVPVNSPHKGQWRGALMFSLIYACISDWVNKR